MKWVAAIRQFLVHAQAPGAERVEVDEAGFCLATPRGEKRRIQWCDVERIIARKVDLLTFDEIRVCFDHADGSLDVNEESDGFLEFMQETVRRFPSAEGWYGKVSQPAFEACQAVLYERPKDRAESRITS